MTPAQKHTLHGMALNNGRIGSGGLSGADPVLMDSLVSNGWATFRRGDYSDSWEITPRGRRDVGVELGLDERERRQRIAWIEWRQTHP